jgi:hypothetical protein
VDPIYSHALSVENISTPQPRALLENVHAIYRTQFRRWFAIMAPTSVLGGAVLLLTTQRINAILRTIPRGEIPTLANAVTISTLRACSLFLIWLLGCFALAAIAIAINAESETESEDDQQVWKHDSYERAREHFGAIFLVAVITLCAFLVGVIGLAFVEIAALKISSAARASHLWRTFGYVGFVIVASIVAWLGAAIPLIVKKDFRVGAALKRSIELSSGYEGALFLLTLESVLGSFIAWYVVTYAMRAVIPVQMQYAQWYGYLLNLVGVLASAAIESPLFIGFSLLADVPNISTRHNDLASSRIGNLP